MFFDNIAYAEPTAGGAPGGNPIMSFLPIILIFVVFYFLLIRPQQKRQKQHMAMIDSLKAGDTILTNGGIYGLITNVIDDKTFLVEISSGVKIKIAKGGVSAKIDEQTAAPAETKESK